jgi:hypothetical protein
MNMDDPLYRCRALIEQKLGWGSSEGWQNQDFETLGERVFEETRVVLSVSTLKRVWGKVRYDSLPSATTLNTLAAFLGYTSWRDFKQQTASAVSREAVSQQPVAEAPVVPRRKKRWLVVLPALLAVLLLTGWLYKQSAGKKTAWNSHDFSFSSQPLAKGIPNSVVFNYDARAAGNDSVFIQQSWDPTRRFAVPRNGNTYTSIYYYPGFFKAKLVVGKQIVKEHSLLIPSGGWVAAVDQQPVPVYFTPGEVMHDGVLGITPGQMERRHIPLQPHLPEVRYCNVGDWKGLLNDNFIFETRLRSDYRQGTAVCQRVTVVIHCENTAIMIPLGIPGCVAEMSLMAVDTGFSAQHADLSGFGCPMHEWVTLRCEARDKQLRFWVNNKEAYQYRFSAAPNRIIGISYRFEGAGSVDAVKFSHPDGRVVFEDTFDKTAPVPAQDKTRKE